MPSWADPANAYEVTERWVNARCRFSAVAEDERFATVFGDFETNGAVELKVFPDAADAVDEYDRLVGGRLEPRAEQVPAATTAEVTGWWDSGVRLELPEVLDPDAYTLGDFEVTSVAVEWVVRHDNLVAESYGTGLAPTDDVGEAAVLLHEVIAAMLNEAARLLSRTG